jgi:hypothetical protein
VLSCVRLRVVVLNVNASSSSLEAQSRHHAARKVRRPGDSAFSSRSSSNEHLSSKSLRPDDSLSSSYSTRSVSQLARPEEVAQRPPPVCSGRGRGQRVIAAAAQRARPRAFHIPPPRLPAVTSTGGGGERCPPEGHSRYPRLWDSPNLADQFRTSRCASSRPRRTPPASRPRTPREGGGPIRQRNLDAESQPTPRMSHRLGRHQGHQGTRARAPPPQPAALGPGRRCRGSPISQVEMSRRCFCQTRGGIRADVVALCRRGDVQKKSKSPDC